MPNLKINYQKSFLPLSSTRGTVEQRISSARMKNLCFYDELQKHIKNDEISPRAFSQALKKIVGNKIGINLVEASKTEQTNEINYCFNEKLSSIGYVLFLPFSYLTDKIHKNSASKFLKVTQKFFNEIHNPKIFARFVSMVNKGYNLDEIRNFYQTEFGSSKRFDNDKLDKFLEGRSDEEKINVLQFFRYKLMSDSSTVSFSKEMDKKIERYLGLKLIRPADYYELGSLKHQEKLSNVSDKLLQIMQGKKS